LAQPSASSLLVPDDEEFTSIDESQIQDQTGEFIAEVDQPLDRDAESDKQRGIFYCEQSLGLSGERSAETRDLEEQSCSLRFVGDFSERSGTEEVDFKSISSNDQLPAHDTPSSASGMGCLLHDDPRVDNQIQVVQAGTQANGTGNQEQGRCTLSAVQVNQLIPQDDDPVVELETIHGQAPGSDRRNR
jgi:hypothetical protein